MARIKRTKLMDYLLDDDGHVIYRTPRPTYGLNWESEASFREISAKSESDEEPATESSEEDLPDVSYDEEGDILYQI